MTRYMQFPTADGSMLLVQVDAGEEPVPGVAKGLGDIAGTAIATAGTTFEDALEGVVRHNAQALIQAVRRVDEPPDEMEVTFGLTVTGDMGNIVVAKAGAEVNYTIRLTWKRQATSAAPPVP